MYSASTASVASTGSTLVGVARAPPPPPTVQTAAAASNSVIFDPSAVFDAASVCFCHRFLNPFGSGTSQCLLNPCLLHYCRVCNIQLNSCRQAKIHSEGKKHEKRLSYLKFCLQSSGSSNGTSPDSSGSSSNSIIANFLAAAAAAEQQPPPQPQPVQQQQPQAVPPTASNCNNNGAMYFGQPQYTSTPAYYYPAASTASQPYQIMSATPTVTTATGYYTTAADYTTPPPTVPPPMMQVVQQQQQQQQQQQHPYEYHEYHNTGQVMHHATNVGQMGHGVMSPSLTSGFSGSGADCKSTETSSILSAASYSSGMANGPIINNVNTNGTSNYHHHHHHHTGSYYSKQRDSYHVGGGGSSSVNYYNEGPKYNSKIANSNNVQNIAPSMAAMHNAESNSRMISMEPNNSNSNTVFCETCQIPFPSVAVLENHLKGSRHARRVKSQQAFRQLKDAGTLFRIRGSSAPVSDDVHQGSGAIRCEVCQVSVNSSHQLQAHLTGHKHKVRAIRRGVKTNQAVLSPSSSLLTSSASVSEMSYQSNSATTTGKPKNKSANAASGSGSAAAATVVAPRTAGNNRVVRTSAGPAKNTPQPQPQPPHTKQQALALSRHRSSGCLQSRHCHSTLSLSRARSSSALNRVQSRSMNLLMIQNSHGMKTTSSDVLSVRSSSSGETTTTSSPSSASSDVNEDDDEEDEGVATDATDKEVVNKTNNIKNRPPRSNRKQKEADGLAQDLNWMKLSTKTNGEVTSNTGSTTTTTTTKFCKKDLKENNKDDKTNNNNNNNTVKIFKRGFNINAQEWKPKLAGVDSKKSVTVASSGNANTSVKDIPMLDVFLQRLDQRRHSSYVNSNNKSDSSSKKTEELQHQQRA